MLFDFSQNEDAYDHQDRSSLWSDFGRLLQSVESSGTTKKNELSQPFLNYRNSDKSNLIDIDFYKKYEEEKIIRSNLQLISNDHYSQLDKVLQIKVSQIIADFYHHVKPSKRIWDRMEFDTEDDLCIRFISSNSEVSVSIEDINDMPNFDSLDSYLSIFHKGRRVSYNRPLRTLIGLINDMCIP